jgi:lipoxygenase
MLLCLCSGMAEPDPTAKHGLRLVVQDYPYAADGLELWSAIKEWNVEYVDIYYEDDAAVQNDVELQKWWAEFRYVGHADKKDAPGWPDVNSKESLIEVLTSSQWICSCQHAAINFGQYAYAGFMPHHPTLTRRLIPDQGTPEWDELQRNPEKFYLSTISDVNSSITTMSVYEVLSSHAANEVYIGDRAAHWAEDKRVCCAASFASVDHAQFF